MNPPATSAEAITKASKSNLALAFVALPRERRAAITTFYAFCRIIDDIADDPALPTEEKARQLDGWKRALTGPFEGEPPLAEEVRQLLKAYPIRPELLEEIILGCEMDLQPQRFQTFGELQRYCYRVASAVGLVSIEIFGYRYEMTKQYAVELGYALQLTNIIRDVAKDLGNGGRIYLPLEDLEHFHIAEEDLRRHRGGPRFRDLMAYQAARAKTFYQRAIAARHPEDRRSLAAAEIMRRVYYRLLQKMEADDFRVFERFYRLNRLEKLAIIARVLAFG